MSVNDPQWLNSDLGPVDPELEDLTPPPPTAGSSTINIISDVITSHSRKNNDTLTKPVKSVSWKMWERFSEHRRFVFSYILWRTAGFMFSL